MVWDLHGALLKKQEFETARLLDFEFRLRVRTMRMLADALGLAGDTLVLRIVLESDEAILRDLTRCTGLTESEIDERFRVSEVEARTLLLAERGDPRPYRLA